MKGIIRCMYCKEKHQEVGDTYIQVQGFIFQGNQEVLDANYAGKYVGHDDVPSANFCADKDCLMKHIKSKKEDADSGIR